MVFFVSCFVYNRIAAKDAKTRDVLWDCARLAMPGLHIPAGAIKANFYTIVCL